jgi:hypothetical protein
MLEEGPLPGPQSDAGETSCVGFKLLSQSHLLVAALF